MLELGTPGSRLDPEDAEARAPCGGFCEGPSHLDLQRALFLTPTSPQVHCGFLQITQAGGETAERFGSAGWAMAARVVPSAGELAGHGRVPEGARFP